MPGGRSENAGGCTSKCRLTARCVANSVAFFIAVGQAQPGFGEDEKDLAIQLAEYSATQLGEPFSGIRKGWAGLAKRLN